MRQSNFYVIAYTVGLTVFCALLLSVVTMALRPLQEANLELERKKNILSTVRELTNTDDVNAIYEKTVRGYVVDFEGDVVKDMDAKSVDVAKQYKEPVEKRKLPVYEIVSESDPNQVQFYVLPVYGKGLWDVIWGYVALENDLNTVKGTSFDHKGETAGLGARISTGEIQRRYAGKKIISSDNKIVSVEMKKGEGLDYSSEPHAVDGMSGATITAKGLNEMLKEYFASYENFIKSKRAGSGKITFKQ